MFRGKLKEEIKNFVQTISDKEMTTNKELNQKLKKLGTLIGDYYPTRDFPRLDLPKFISYDLLVAKGRV